MADSASVTGPSPPPPESASRGAAMPRMERRATADTTATERDCGSASDNRLVEHAEGRRPECQQRIVEATVGVAGLPPGARADAGTQDLELAQRVPAVCRVERR